MKNLSENLTSQDFKDAARKAILAIIFFIISYFFLLLLAIGLAILCGFLGIGLISFKVHWITFLLGAGLIGMGLIVVIFLIKFIFKSNKIDRSHLIELSEADAPLLYEEIRKIVNHVQTDFPKRIYVSHEVNAAVFYDSTFLSMIFPVRKNLQIGMALVNSLSKNELKAILAHEFGHFSQRSMKVGSYVYTVNQIIYNMLYDNDSYGNLIQRFANISSYFALFVTFGVKIIEGIQWILKKLYNVVNLQHLNLSREMEFHADAIAVNTVGSKPFISSMMRLDLSNNSFDRTINYYEQKIEENIRPNNIYPQHRFIMDMIANESGIEFVNGLPNVTEEYFNRYNKSKLVIKNQWASHPSTEDRIAAIKKGDFHEGEDDGAPATLLFADIEATQVAVTSLLFANVVYKGNINSDIFEDFKIDYVKKVSDNAFPKLFNGYYDSYQPSKVDVDSHEAVVNFEELYGAESIDLVYSSFALEADINFLKQVQMQVMDIKSFEYDGNKYQKYDVHELLPKLEKELSEIKKAIAKNEQLIYTYFKQKAEGTNSKFKEKYDDFLSIDKVCDEAALVYSKAIEQTQFIQYTTPINEIEANLARFSVTETELKEQIVKMLTLSTSESFKIESKNHLDTFIAKKNPFYFGGESYNDSELDILFLALNAYRDLLNHLFFETKKILLLEMEYIYVQSVETSEKSLI